LYNVTEAYGKAEPLLQEALATTVRSLGADHPRVVLCLNLVSLVHSRRDDFDSAIPEMQRALAIAERTLEADDFTVLSIVGNLGDFYALLKDFERAEPLLTRTLQGLEKTFGPDHPSVAIALQNLGTIAREKKQYARALELLWRAVSVREKALGARSSQTAALLINIGNVYHDQGDDARAREVYERALGVLETSAGPYHSLTMMAVSDLARIYTLEGDTARALEYEARLDRIVEKNIDLNLAIGSEREKLAYLSPMLDRTSRTISLNARNAPEDASATELAATVILQRKGRVLDAMSGSLGALRQRMNAGDQAVLDRLGAATSQLAALALNGPGRTPVAEYQHRLTSLEDQREKLEAEISGRSAEFRAQSVPVTLAAVEAAIPARSALVEFAVFRPFDPKGPISAAEAYGERRYVAYVVRQNAGVQWKELGPAKDIDAAVAVLLEALRDPKRDDVRQRAREVDRQVMQPVRALIGGATQLLVSPDGELNLVPFEALVDEDGRYLVERYAISYLTTGRDLLRIKVARASHSEPVVVADPFFGEPQAVQTAGAAAPNVKPGSGNASRRSITVAGDLSSVYFAPLAGTGDEARAIKSLFPDARVLTGPHATKAALKQLDAPSILHIATHGFFLQEADRQTGPVPGAAANGRRAADGVVAIQNPLLRAGLALSGANVDKGATDGGILTALEASNLNLFGTKLVTLSACDTGVGEVKGGEGVYGLRRAFFLAGAETVVMSLWSVSDYVTRQMMTGYYSGLKKGLGRGDALRQSQLAMLTRANRRHPFYWASFIQAGEWANLDGRRELMSFASPR
jgi:CHAT domain-containing protein/Tfp pilus assembly protein PilF